MFTPAVIAVLSTFDAYIKSLAAEAMPAETASEAKEWLVPQGSRTKGVICSLTSSTEADRSTLGRYLPPETRESNCDRHG